MEPESCLGTDMIEAVERHLQGKEKKGDKYVKRGGSRHENTWRKIEEEKRDTQRQGNVDTSSVEDP